MRRVGEHQRKQPWITKTVRIDVTWYYADEIAEAERLAIEREHPVYNITHNRGRVRIEAAAEVTMPEATGEGLVFMAALIVTGGMGATWAVDSLANGNVRRRAARAGLRVEVPPARRGRCRCRPPTGGRAQPCASRRRRNPAAGAARGSRWMRSASPGAARLALLTTRPIAPAEGRSGTPKTDTQAT